MPHIEEAIGAPADLRVVTLYDPFVFATPDREFFERFDGYDRALERDMFAAFWASGAIRRTCFAEEDRLTLLRRKYAGRISERDGLPCIDCEHCQADLELRRTLLGIVRYDYLSVLFVVDSTSDALLDALRLWTRSATAPPQSVWAGAYNLPYPKLLSQRWAMIRQLLDGLKPPEVVAAFGNEGTLLALLSTHDLSALSAKL